jgi:hypothetical protein
MRSISPVVEGFQQQEIKLAENQSEYLMLPALPVDRGQKVITRWRFSWIERLEILFGADLYLWTWTFGHPFQPVALETRAPVLSHSGDAS